MHRRLITVISALLTATAGLVGAAKADAASASPAAAPDPYVAGTYFANDRPSRLFDSRRTSFGRPLRAGETVDVKVTGRGDAPHNGISAVVLNLTVTGPTTSGNIVALPKGVNAATSSLNFAAGETRANLVTVPVSADGYVSVRNNGRGTTHVIADVQGYYFSGFAVTEYGGADFFPLRTVRALDTRTSTPVSPERTLAVPVRVPGEGLARSTSALTVTVSVVSPAGNGYLTLWNGMTYPTTSHLNYAKGRTTTNSVVVPVTTYTNEPLVPYLYVSVFGAASVNVVIDVNGAYSSSEQGGSVLRTLAIPQRIVDSRISRGTATLGAADTNAVQAPRSVSPSGTTAILTNTTVVAPTASTYLALWQFGTSRPYGSNLNAQAGQTVANQAVVPVSSGGLLDLYNHAGHSDVLVDVVGRFEKSRR